MAKSSRDLKMPCTEAEGLGQPPAPPRSFAPCFGGERKKVLVIEDNQFIRENLLELLEIEGFEVIGAENGSIGVQLAKQEQPDLIICNQMMANLDGYDVLEELRQDPGTRKIPFKLFPGRICTDELLGF